GLHSALDTLVNSGNILFRDRAANDAVDELVTLATVGLDLDLDVTILALTARLTSVLGLLVGFLANGLAVSNLGSADVGLDLELTQQTVDDDLQMELAHAGDDGLTGLFVGPGTEGGVLFRQLGQSNAHLLGTGIGLGLNVNTD